MNESTLNDQLRIGGSLVLSKIGPTDRAKLEAGFKSIGYERYVPEPRTPASALTGALQEVFKKGKESSRILVRPLEDADGFAVVKEERGDTARGNRYAGICTATVTKSESLDRMVINIYGDYTVEQYEEVVAAYSKLENVLGASAVGACIDRILKALDGVDMTAGMKDDQESKGGSRSVWWLGKDRTAEFRTAAKIIEDCGLKQREDGRGSCNRVNLITCIADEAMVRAVGDGLCTEVTNEVGRIEHEIRTGELTARQMANRREKGVELRKKLERYERSFDVYLTKLHEELDRVDTATVMAALLESGAPDLELVVA